MQRISIWLICILLVFPLFGGINRINADPSLEVTSIKLSTSDNPIPFHVEPAMAILDDGTIVAGWKESYSQDGPGFAVSYVVSSDGGSTWSTPELIPSSFQGETNNLGRQSLQSDPWMMSINNTLYFAYLEFNSTHSQVTIAKTSDNGGTWDLVKATENDGFADKETFDIDDDGNIYLVYDDVDDEGVSIRLSRSYDGGNSYSDNIVISDKQYGDYVGPYILHGGSDKLYVGFTQFTNSDTGDLYLDRSFDGGDTWGNDTDINPAGDAAIFTTNPNTGGPMKVSLAVLDQSNDGRLFYAWDDVNSDIDNANWENRGV